jgi:hypothetical protein
MNHQRTQRFAPPLIGLMIVLIWSAPGSAQAAETSPGYAAFPLLQTRNMFDPDRRAPRPQGAARETQVSARVESMALTGTMVQSDQARAFFGGSRPEHRQVLSLHEEIAGYTLVAITTTHVELERDGQRFRLPVGQGLRREGDAAWEITAEVPRPSAKPSPNVADRAGSERGADGALGDMMKRLMQRRQQEVSR